MTEDSNPEFIGFPINRGRISENPIHGNEGVIRRKAPKRAVPPQSDGTRKYEIRNNEIRNGWLPPTDD